MTQAIKRGLDITRYQEPISAHCADCEWQDFAYTRNDAIQHARKNRHRVYYETDDTTIYDGRGIPD